MSRLLIVSPGFHGYYASIARSFEELGYDVSAYCYDVAASGAEKVWNKFRHELAGRVLGGDALMSAETVSQRAVAAIHEAQPDIVLVIRGDILTEDFWVAASEKGRVCAVWMYDEMRRTSFDAPMVAQYAHIATYSSEDTDILRNQGFESLHVPLGFDSSAKPATSNLGTNSITFVGAPFAKRTQALQALACAGLPVKAWGRGWSDHPVDKARTWRLHGSGIPNGRDVPGNVTLRIMNNSVATLNIHGDQDGFTMRTFEASGIGAVQLVDRADVSAYYEPGREVLVFESHDELIELARQIVAAPKDFEPLREAARARTLAEHCLSHRAIALQTLWA